MRGGWEMQTGWAPPQSTLAVVKTHIGASRRLIDTAKLNSIDPQSRLAQGL